MVKSKQIYSIQSFCDEFLGFCPIIKGNKDELRTLMDKNGFENLWDYDFTEIDEIVGNKLNVVLVDTSYIDDKSFEIVKEYRWVEVEDAEDNEPDTSYLDLLNDSCEKIDSFKEKLGETFFDAVMEDDNFTYDMSKAMISVLRSCKTKEEYDIAERMIEAICGYKLETLVDKIKEKDHKNFKWESV